MAGNYTLCYKSYHDGFVIKYSNNGEVEWAESIGGQGDDHITQIISTTDEGYIVGGYFGSENITVGDYTLTGHGTNYYEYDGMIIKYSASGEVEWAESIGENDKEAITSVTEIKDGGYIAAVGEYTERDNGTSYFSSRMIVKYSSSGEVEWTEAIGETSNDQLYSVVGTTDGGYIIGGSFSGPDIIKYNSNGDIEWTETIERVSITSVTETTDGGYAVGGYFNSRMITIGKYTLANHSGNADGMIIKYSSSGDIEWAECIGGTDNDYIESVSETTDGGYAVGGYFESDSITIGDYTLTNYGSWR